MSEHLVERIKSLLQIAFYAFLISAIVAALLWSLYFRFSHAIPVTGTVIEKMEIGTGYNVSSIHALKLDADGDDLMYITVSTRVYNAVSVGVRYEFTGPRGGSSYDGIAALSKE